MRLAALGSLQDPYLISAQRRSFIRRQRTVQFFHCRPAASRVPSLLASAQRRSFILHECTLGSWLPDPALSGVLAASSGCSVCLCHFRIRAALRLFCGSERNSKKSCDQSLCFARTYV
jgi:hypothetical protein